MSVFLIIAQCCLMWNNIRYVCKALLLLGRNQKGNPCCCDSTIILRRGFLLKSNILKETFLKETFRNYSWYLILLTDDFNSLTSNTSLTGIQVNIQGGLSYSGWSIIVFWLSQQHTRSVSVKFPQKINVHTLMFFLSGDSINDLHQVHTTAMEFATIWSHCLQHM